TQARERGGGYYRGQRPSDMAAWSRGAGSSGRKAPPGDASVNNGPPGAAWTLSTMVLVGLSFTSVKRGCPARYCGTRPPTTSAEARSERVIGNCGRKRFPLVDITNDRRF